jgi:hypothetical protein
LLLYVIRMPLRNQVLSHGLQSSYVGLSRRQEALRCDPIK